MNDLAVLFGSVRRNGHWISTNIYVNDGTISRISNDVLPARRVVDASGQNVIPGLIDPHVHFELDLGRYKSVDDFSTGPRAAAYGGVSAYIDFLDPARDAHELVSAYETRLRAAKKSPLDYAFHATICAPKGDLETFVTTMLDLNLTTLKLFTTYSESGRRTEDEDIIELLKLSEEYGFLILAHIENDEAITLDPQHTICDLLRSRPTEAETLEALKLAEFVRQNGGSLYMVHTSSGHTLEALKTHYGDILNRRFFIESCPQYMTFTHDVLNREDGYLYTCAPPLRTSEERDRLVYLHDYIDVIGTDHCAFMRADKDTTRLADAPLGFGGIEHSFACMHALLGDGVIEKMTARVADIHALPKKGRIDVGHDADLTIYVEEDGIMTENHAASDYSVYHGLKRSVRMVSTLSRGRFILENGRYLGGEGRYIKERKR